MNACFMVLCLKNWITGKPKTQFLGIPLLHGDDMSEAEVGKAVCWLLYSQTLPYRHLLNTDTSLLQTVCFVRGKRKPLPGCKENHFYSLPFGQAEASIY